LLLLDEPLSNLDAALRQEMRFELKELHKRIGTTTLYVTHDQEEALVLADRLIVMNLGSIEQAGSPEDIYLRPRTRFVAGFVGTTNLFQGLVKAKDASRRKILFETDFGTSIWAGSDPDTFTRLSEGEPAAVSIRPEDMSIDSRATQNGTSVPVQLKAAAFLGSHYDLHLEVNGQPCRAKARSLDAFADGAGSIQINEGLAWVVQ
jgi:ABC-type Fe3+/spermidine/putrescine transport system ATPase subunit